MNKNSPLVFLLDLNISFVQRNKNTVISISAKKSNGKNGHNSTQMNMDTYKERSQSAVDEFP